MQVATMKPQHEKPTRLEDFEGLLWFQDPTGTWALYGWASGLCWRLMDA